MKNANARWAILAASVMLLAAPVWAARAPQHNWYLDTSFGGGPTNAAIQYAPTRLKSFSDGGVLAEFRHCAPTWGGPCEDSDVVRWFLPDGTATNFPSSAIGLPGMGPNREYWKFSEGGLLGITPLNHVLTGGDRDQSESGPLSTTGYDLRSTNSPVFSVTYFGSTFPAEWTNLTGIAVNHTNQVFILEQNGSSAANVPSITVLDSPVLRADSGPNTEFVHPFLREWAIQGPRSDVGVMYTGEMDVGPNGWLYVHVGMSVQAYDVNGTHMADSGILDDRHPSGLRSLDVGPEGLVYITYYNTLQILDPQLQHVAYIDPPVPGTHANPGFAAVTVGPDGTVYASWRDTWTLLESRYRNVWIWRRGIRTMQPVTPDILPLPLITRTVQRPNSGIIDIDFQVSDPDDATTHAEVVALVDGSNTVKDIVLLNTLIEGTDSQRGAGINVGQTCRLSWDAAADLTNDFVNLTFRVLAKDDTALIDLHFIALPANGGDPALTINRSPLVEEDFVRVWQWLVASRDAAVTRLSPGGHIEGVGGSYDGVRLYNATTGTTPEGRAFVFERLSVRAATGSEVQRAREAGTPGVVNQFEPRSRIGERPRKVNAYGIDTGDWGANAVYVVPLP